MAAAETRVFLQQFFEREFKVHGSAERACKLLQDYQKREKELIISVSFKKISTIFMNMRENLCMCGWGWGVVSWVNLNTKVQPQLSAVARTKLQSFKVCEVLKFSVFKTLQRHLCLCISLQQPVIKTSVLSVSSSTV